MTRYYPLSVYLFGLGLLWLNTLPSSYLLGTDMHLEYYFASQVMSGGWDPTIPHPGNAALGTVLLAPAISWATHIPLLWVFKIAYPMIFALVPVFLYLIWTRYFSKRESLLAAAFFILVPTFTMELTGIGKQQIAEVFLVLHLWALLATKLKTPQRIAVLLATAALTVTSHYSTGVVLIILSVLYLIWLLIYKRVAEDRHVPEWAQRRTSTATVTAMTVVILIVSVGAIAYWGWAGGGTPLRYMTHLIPMEEKQVWIYKIGHIPPVESNGVSSRLLVSGRPARVMDLGSQQYDTLMRAALGLDFFATTTPGKVFRVLQYITQLGLVVGIAYTVHRRKVRKPYKILALACFSVLSLCVVTPAFAAILNATRWYHLALFGSAPLLVVTFTRILKKPMLLAGLLVIYGIFTTGVFFEIAKIDSIHDPDIPYSVGLSGQRLDIAGNYTADDLEVREWLLASDIKEIHSDIPGMMFLQERMALEKLLYITPRADLVEDTETGTVVFLRSENIRSRTITTFRGIGARGKEALDLSGMSVIYRVGDSIVARIR